MNTTLNRIAALREEALQLQPTELPVVISQLAALDAELRLVLMRPVPTPVPPPDDADEWMTVDEAAAFLKQSPRWIKTHSGELEGSTLPDRGGLRFSRRKLNLFMKRRVG